MDVWAYSTQLVALLTMVKSVVFLDNLHEKSGNHRCFWSVYHHNITTAADRTHMVKWWNDCILYHGERCNLGCEVPKMHMNL